MLKKILQRLGYFKIKNPKIYRNYAGANTNRLFASWTTTNASEDKELRYNLKVLRARSRELAHNNDYAKKFLRMVQTNVVGKDGIILQSQVKNEKGNTDKLARIRIEEGWKEWSRKGQCDISGLYSFRDIQKLVIRTVAQDGEILVRKVYDADNKFSFSLQLLEADHLDEQHNEILPNGNRIKMGIEYNKNGRPIAYHIYRDHPGDLGVFNQSYQERIRVPANEIIHIFVPVRVSQTRGIPWMHAAMTRMNMLGGYEEAELTAARIAAAKGGFYEQSPETEYVGDSEENGTPIMEVEPGVFDIMPPGWKFHPWDPQHPTTAFKDFEKAILRGIASGLDVSYNYLANDLEGVNYSSIRAGVLDERDVWRDLQVFLIEHFLDIVFNEWLRMALLTQAVKLPISKIDKFRAVKWQTRGWAWVDPLKDIQAKEKELQLGVTTKTDIAAESGKDLEEIYQKLSEEDDLAEQYELSFEQTKNEVIQDEE